MTAAPREPRREHLRELAATEGVDALIERLLDLQDANDALRQEVTVYRFALDTARDLGFESLDEALEEIPNLRGLEEEMRMQRGIIL
jgi:hypothetical protein